MDDNLADLDGAYASDVLRLQNKLSEVEAERDAALAEVAKWECRWPQLVDKMKRVHKAMRERAEKAEAERDTFSKAYAHVDSVLNQVKEQRDELQAECERLKTSLAIMEQCMAGIYKHRDECLGVLRTAEASISELAPLAMGTVLYDRACSCKRQIAAALASTSEPHPESDEHAAPVYIDGLWWQVSVKRVNP